MNNFGVSIKGGAARGLGSIAFIRFLQEEGLKPSVLAGSSSGGIVAAMYALGFTWQEMIEIIKEIRVRRYISLLRFVQKGYMMEEECFKDILKTYAKDRDIESLDTKLILFASDVKNKKRYFIENGSLVEGLHASCAYPFILPRARINHINLVDGDLTNTYSASYLRSKGAKKVIGVGYKVNGSTLSFGHGFGKILDMYRFFMSQIEVLTDGIDPVDLEFRYNAGKYNYLDFKEVDGMVNKAYASIERNKKAFIKLINE